MISINTAAGIPKRSPICTESVAAYTDNDGRFFIRNNDTRQRKVVRQRGGDPDKITPEEQAYHPLLIEYRCGEGTVLFSNLLIGTKYNNEPVAQRMLMNLVL